jgi:hypothetical protein
MNKKKKVCHFNELSVYVHFLELRSQLTRKDQLLAQTKLELEAMHEYRV